MLKCSFILTYYKTEEHLNTLSSIVSVIQAAFTLPALNENYIEPFGKEFLVPGVYDAAPQEACPC